jgi:hypothetical protein
MPEISRFYGIIIRMFAEAGGEHHRPHFHAYCQKDSLVVAIETIEILGGSLPPRERRLVEAWAELHRDELLDDWRRLQAGRLPAKIEPLK